MANEKIQDLAAKLGTAENDLKWVVCAKISDKGLSLKGMIDIGEGNLYNPVKGEEVSAEGRCVVEASYLPASPQAFDLKFDVDDIPGMERGTLRIHYSRLQ